MSKFTVTVKFELYEDVIVEADNEDEAYDLAEEQAANRFEFDNFDIVDILMEEAS